MQRQIIAGGAGLLLLFAASDCLGVPSFTRKYGTSCSTCHEAFPRRNIVGEAFRLNGYRFIDDEAVVKRQPVELGDEAYNRLWPKAIWSGDIPAYLPLSLITEFQVEIDMDGSRDQEVLFLFPEQVELVYAGSLGKTFSFYGDFQFLQKDFGGKEIESWLQMKARVGIHDIVGPENLLNLNIGTVGTQTMGLYPAMDANNLTTHYYQYSSWTMPAVSLTGSGLNDFRGNPFSLQPQVGLELYGYGERWKVAGGVVSGDVTNPVHGPDSNLFFVGTGRNRGNKDGFAQFSYKIGGLGFDGSGAEVDDPTQADPQFWRDDSLIASVYGYVGSAEIRTEAANGVVWTGDDFFWRVGGGLQQKYKDLTVAAGYMFGRNDRPYGNLSSESVDSHAWYAETSYTVYPWLMPYVRYEGLLLGLPKGVAGLNSDQDQQRFVLGAKAMIRANISLSLETLFYTQGADLKSGFDKTLFCLLNVSF